MGLMLLYISVNSLLSLGNLDVSHSFGSPSEDGAIKGFNGDVEGNFSAFIAELGLGSRPPPLFRLDIPPI